MHQYTQIHPDTPSNIIYIYRRKCLSYGCFALRKSSLLQVASLLQVFLAQVFRSTSVERILLAQVFLAASQSCKSIVQINRALFVQINRANHSCNHSCKSFMPCPRLHGRARPAMLGTSSRHIEGECELRERRVITPISAIHD